MVAKKIFSSFWVHLNKFDVNICVISGKVPRDNRVMNGKKKKKIAQFNQLHHQLIFCWTQGHEFILNYSVCSGRKMQMCKELSFHA